MPTKHTSTRRSTTLLGEHARHRTSGLAALSSSSFGPRDIHHSRFLRVGIGPRTPRQATSCHSKMQASATTTTLSSVVVTWPSTASMYRPPPSHTIPAWAIRTARDYTSRRSPSASAVVPKRSSSAKSIAVLSLKSRAAFGAACAHTLHIVPDSGARRQHTPPTWAWTHSYLRCLATPFALPNRIRARRHLAHHPRGCFSRRGNPIQAGKHCVPAA